MLQDYCGYTFPAYIVHQLKTICLWEKKTTGSIISVETGHNSYTRQVVMIIFELYAIFTYRTWVGLSQRLYNSHVDLLAETYSKHTLTKSQSTLCRKDDEEPIYSKNNKSFAFLSRFFFILIALLVKLDLAHSGVSLVWQTDANLTLCTLGFGSYLRELTV